VLAPGRDGDALAHAAHDAAQRLRAARAAVTGDRAPGVADDGSATGGIAFRFDDVHDGTRVVLEAGKPDGKRRLRARIDHLLLASVLGEAARTHLIGYDTKAGTTVEVVYAGFDRDAARDALETLLALWREGQASPLPFAPKSAYAYAAAWHAKPDAPAAWKAAWAAYAPHQYDGEREDRWLRLAFRPHGLLGDFDDAIARRFRTIATQVFDAREPSP
jgi:exonuclease V gamma subunit